ncbi:MAG: putative NRPS-like protein biosynthetic cluster [Pycnora praestabilis]|nr:MAG: putative NRPS-like protein biosynthetic cluster [Pycnora praestabilis]
MGSVVKVTDLTQVLYGAAWSSSGITIYDDWESTSCERMPYHELLRVSLIKAKQVRAFSNGQRGTVVFLHFASFRENIEWFWAVVLAGLLPAISTPLPADPDRRRNHLAHVHDMLRHPVTLTSRDLAKDFEGVEHADLKIVNELNSVDTGQVLKPLSEKICPTDPAVLMLTSGSSGNAKAVVLRHEQIIASVKGKSSHFGTTDADIFMNWIGFDHVASLIETHIHAMYIGAELVHIPAPALIANPMRFLQFIDRHRVTYTFAPHFFLARLLQSMDNSNARQAKYDISALRHLISGGESNLVATVVALTKVLQDHNLKGEVIRPGFGMTETCAGSIYSRNCPTYDITSKNDFASLGKPVSGIQMRIMNDNGHEAPFNEIGNLQVTGPLVFQEYFNNPKATRVSFTDDGWFVTGDRAYVDTNGNLNIAGREKESINLNGIKHFPHEIESALENANIPGLTPSYTVVFSVRLPKSHAEELCVVYHPTFCPEDIARRVETASKIVLVVGSLTTSRPKHIIPLPKTFLHKSALGKLSRAKIRTSFENEEYEEYQDSRDLRIKDFKAARRENPATATENTILTAVRDVVDVPEEELSVNNSMFDFGVTSTDLFTLKRRIEKDLHTLNPVPVGILLTTPTIRGIASELDRLGQGSQDEYNPVVPLRSNPTSTKTPLWLVHPGSGDVLVFVALAKYFPDRTVYGLRTRGLNTGIADQSYFTSIAAIADCYVDSIRRHQPHGPYAIAGYSLGSTVAFEIAKRLDSSSSDDRTVAFLGIFDSPPHMRALISKLDWTDVLLNVAYFLELISEDYSTSIAAGLHRRTPEQALEFIMNCAPTERLEALAMDSTRLRKLTDVTNAFGQAGREYEPQGRVRGMDVFWVTPLASVAGSRREWMEEHLVRWGEFSAEAPRFHECEGVHSKMLNAEYVASFQKCLKGAMAARGV